MESLWQWLQGGRQSAHRYHWQRRQSPRVRWGRSAQRLDAVIQRMSRCNLAGRPGGPSLATVLEHRSVHGRYNWWLVGREVSPFPTLYWELFYNSKAYIDFESIFTFAWWLFFNILENLNSPQLYNDFFNGNIALIHTHSSFACELIRNSIDSLRQEMIHISFLKKHVVLNYAIELPQNVYIYHIDIHYDRDILTLNYIQPNHNT